MTLAFPNYTETSAVKSERTKEKIIKTLNTEGDAEYTHTFQHARLGGVRSELGSPRTSRGNSLKAKASEKEYLARMTNLHLKSARNNKVSYSIALKEALLAE